MLLSNLLTRRRPESTESLGGGRGRRRKRKKKGRWKEGRKKVRGGEGKEDGREEGRKRKKS